jgi:PST family polysaccharide transporter
MSASAKSSHSQILKSSSLIGGSSLINILVGMIRVKFTAVYLGTLGVGLFGAYSTILGPLAMLAGMGINSSGVRQIAEAAGKGDQEAVARSLLTVRRVSWVTGLLGMVLLISLAYPLSVATFGNSSQVTALRILSATLLLGSVAGGFGAIIQGTRRIRDMALQGIIGSLASLPISIPMMMLWRENALVPMMLVSALFACFTTWWFSRRVQTVSVQMSIRDTWNEAQPLLKLGIVFMSAGLMTAATAYLQRVMIIRMLGLEANGIYASAWNLSNYYIGFILGAMGADFYPRLTAVNQNHSEVNRLVNEQTEVGTLMALPGIIATITLAPLIIQVFYTAAFLSAVDLLRWQTLGLMLRLISWPMGFIMLAKGEKGWFFWNELLANVVSIGLLWLGIHFFGLVGTGMAFFALYVYQVGVIIIVSKRLTGFQWHGNSRKLLLITTILLLITSVIVYSVNTHTAAVLGCILAASTACFSLKEITRLTGRNPIEVFWAKIKNMLPKAR